MLVESATSDKTDKASGVNGIEIWRMPLEANSTDFVRLAYFSNNPGWKACNPVVSPDGCTMAVQSSRNDVVAAVGYDLYLVSLE